MAATFGGQRLKLLRQLINRTFEPFAHVQEARSFSEMSSRARTELSVQAMLLEESAEQAKEELYAKAEHSALNPDNKDAERELIKSMIDRRTALTAELRALQALATTLGEQTHWDWDDGDANAWGSDDESYRHPDVEPVRDITPNLVSMLQRDLAALAVPAEPPQAAGVVNNLPAQSAAPDVLTAQHQPEFPIDNTGSDG
eukprot:TRINITY_DN31574_c0_g1_i1.p1 TRINITY_DN31574_c0_g1~~TRINITY_DN31574_c0_g1_i1.p1  ORF type:complete len:200 (-),score=28.36 TRINITY_DN31574_c0_g1_i1:82-681(-)